jgi:HAD superfamily hydrolase (TIGR01509 family)
MPLRALIFDFDGLIIDSETAVADSWRELYASQGLDFPEHLWRRMVGTRNHDDILYNDLAEKTGQVLDVTALEPQRKARSLQIANGLPALPGVVAHIEAACAAGLALAIASSSSDWWVSGHLERLGLRDHFGVTCTRELTPLSKPDPGVYLAALEALGVAASDAIAYEDTDVGVAAARAAGLAVVAVPGSYSEHMDFSAANVVVSSLADVEPQALWKRLVRG